MRKRQRFSAGQWTAWLSEFEQGEFTVTEFCRLKGVCAQSFYRWRKRLRGTPDVPEFVPVAISVPAAVEIELPGGVTIRVAAEASSLRPVLQALCTLDAGR